MAKLTRLRWGLQQEDCMACRIVGPAEIDPNLTREVHEIARGPGRQAALEEPAAWLAVCREHHEEMGDYSLWPVVRQLALKRLCDPKRYDRRKVNELRHRASEAISEAEVLRAQSGLYNPLEGRKVIALDNGIKTGWAQTSTVKNAVYSGVRNMKTLPVGPARYAEYCNLLHHLEKPNPLVIAVELPGQYKSWDAAVPQYAYYAFLQEFCFRREIELVGYAAGHIRSILVGDGGANKEAVAKAVSERFARNPPINIKAGDEADALAVLATVLQDPEAWKLVPKGGG